MAIQVRTGAMLTGSLLFVAGRMHHSWLCREVAALAMVPTPHIDTDQLCARVRIVTISVLGPRVCDSRAEPDSEPTTSDLKLASMAVPSPVR